jgi:type II secretory pathway component PulF
MPVYRYVARTNKGANQKGTVDAASEAKARALLGSRQLTVLSIAPEKPAAMLHRPVFGGKINGRDLILLSRQLATMVRAGVPIIEAIRTLRRQIQKPAFQALLDNVAYEIEGGASLSRALAHHPETFSLFYIGVIQTGEASGRLSESLKTLANAAERAYIFNRKIKAALMYPAFVLAAVLVVIIITFYFILPQLLELFAQTKVPLPLPTRILISFTEFSQSYWYVLLIMIAALGLIIRSYLKTPEGQYNMSAWLLQVPVINEFMRKVYLSRLTSILYTLFSSDVPVIESLKIARESIGNKVYQRILGETAEAVKGGSSMSAIWAQERHIPPMLTTMVAIGERSGEIEKAFEEAQRFFNRDVDDILESITVFLEPLLVIILGIGVGFIVAAVILPIYNLVLVL